MLCFLYHNDNVYTILLQVNRKAKTHFGLEPLKRTNDFAHFFDIKGKIKKLFNPLKDTDFIDITISEESILKMQISF